MSGISGTGRPPSAIHGINYHKPPRQQPIGTLTQANPVSGTKYTLLDTVTNVRVQGIEAEVTWTVQPSPLEIHLTIDGFSRTIQKANPVTATPYYWDVWLGIILATALRHVPFFFEARSLKVELETTGGTVQSLDGRIAYALF